MNDTNKREPASRKNSVAPTGEREGFKNQLANSDSNHKNADDREDKLAKALRENLRRRKSRPSSSRQSSG